MKVDNVVILVFKCVVDINLEDDVLVFLDEKERQMVNVFYECVFKYKFFLMYRRIVVLFVFFMKFYELDQYSEFFIVIYILR